MLSEVSYATFANYSPRGVSDLSKKSKRFCSRLKAADQAAIARVMESLQLDDADQVRAFIDRHTILAPIPGSAPGSERTLWPAKIICDSLHESGYGAGVIDCVRRTRSVPKSAFAAPGERPTLATHYETFRVEPILFQPQKITLVDDVLTKGRTAFAAAMRVHEAFPEAEIRVFAIMRTQGLFPEILSFREPALGRLVLNRERTDVVREP